MNKKNVVNVVTNAFYDGMNIGNDLSKIYNKNDYQQIIQYYQSKVNNNFNSLVEKAFLDGLSFAEDISKSYNENDYQQIIQHYKNEIAYCYRAHFN